MGGCKCQFYGCENSTIVSQQQSAEKLSHFFHFPVRDWDRVVQWAILSNNMDFLSLPSSKLKNKVVCDLHFQEESFMNYKRERLIKKAIPTIYVKDGIEIDLELNPEPYVIENYQKPVLSNPSEAFKLSVSNPIDLVENKEDLYQLVDEEEVPAKKIKLEKSSASVLEQQTKSSPAAASSKFTVLNKNANQKCTKPTRTSQDVSLVPAVSKTIKLAPVIKKELVKKKFNIIRNEVAKAPIVEAPRPEFMVITMPMEEIEQINEIPIVEEVSVPPAEPDYEMQVDLMPILMDSLKQIGEIKSILNVKQAEKPLTIKEEVVSSMTPSQLNKVQLFNGIKRYLSPAMQALLRIELFSNAEREYKQDEKVLSTEILKLGNPVYDFLCEEWRLRLPPKKDVQVWINEQPNLEDDDAC
ncbi:unnamed protein product [Diamesa serratosioi]